MKKIKNCEEVEEGIYPVQCKKRGYKSKPYRWKNEIYFEDNVSKTLSKVWRIVKRGPIWQVEEVKNDRNKID